MRTPHSRRSFPAALVTCLALFALVTGARPAAAGPNAGGVLIVHEVTGLSTVCDDSLAAPVCAAADNQAEIQPMICWRVYAAFPDGSSPRLKTLSWGCRIDPTIHVTAANLPDPDRDFEITQGGWPDTDGCSIGESFWDTRTSQVAFCHWFEGYATGPGTWSAGPHIVQTSVFLDDATPPNSDSIRGYGSLGFGIPGETPCPVPEPGACCFGDASCQFLLAVDCAAANGFFLDLVPCDPNPCPGQWGACCWPDGTCSAIEMTDCDLHDGVWIGMGTPCDPNPCAQPFGACCFPSGACTVLQNAPCEVQGGVWHGVGTNCSPNPCAQPWGACCFQSGSCTYVAEASCTASGGDWQGAGALCAPNPCPQPSGACCFLMGECLFLTSAACSAQGGVWHGFSSDCDPNPCPLPSGACCFPSDQCSFLTEASCAVAGGEWLGVGTDCYPNPCLPPPGPNVGGVLVVHDTGLAYTEGQSGFPSDPPPSCELVDNQAQPDTPLVWKVYAVFPVSSSPRLKGLAFGEQFAPGSIVIEGAGLPNPGDFEIPQDGWPSSADGGVGIAFYTVQTSTISEVYWFGGYGQAASVWNAAPHPSQESVFVDDAEPAHTDPIEGFGSIGFGIGGFTPCAIVGATGACCDYATGYCEVTTPSGCAYTWLGEDVPCDTGTCPSSAPVGACCDFATGACSITTEAGCSFEFLGVGVPCNSSTCAAPTPTERMSWGRLKNLYR